MIERHKALFGSEGFFTNEGNGLQQNYTMSCGVREFRGIGRFEYVRDTLLKDKQKGLFTFLLLSDREGNAGEATITEIKEKNLGKIWLSEGHPNLDPRHPSHERIWCAIWAIDWDALEKWRP